MHPFTAAAAEARRQIAAMKARTKLLQRPEVRAAYLAFPRSIRKQVNVSIGIFENSVRLTLTLRDLDSLKSDRRLLRVLEAFVGSEWTAYSSDFTGNGTPNRDFSFVRTIRNEGEPPFTIGVYVYAYVKADSPTCRVIVKGMREVVRQEPITEIVCEG